MPLWSTLSVVPPLAAPPAEEPQAVSAPSATVNTAAVSSRGRRKAVFVPNRMCILLAGWVVGLLRGPSRATEPGTPAGARRLGLALHRGGGERSDEHDAGEHVGRPGGRRGQGETSDAGAEGDNPENGSACVESSGPDLRGAQEGGSEGRQQVGRAGSRRAGA